MERKARSLYLKQASEATRLKLQEVLSLPESRLTLLIPLDEVTNKRTKVLFRCECGEEVLKRPTDVIEGRQIECKKCACRRRMQRDLDKFVPQLRANAQAMKGVAKVDPHWRSLVRRCTCAKARCCNEKHRAWHNYGGRGITFDFESPSAMAQWIVEHLGYPGSGQSIDRIDNSKGYAPGNLRWADSATQANNKREYKCSPDWERVRRLAKLKPEFGFERLRELVKEGLTDDEILSRKRTASGRPRVRHS
nr:MAG TPA: hypothetical protein [Caudoviricetes sp.]